MRDGRFDPETQVLDFSHVPKCGGTTVHDFLYRLMDGRYVHCAPGLGWEDRIDAAVGAGGHQLRGQNPICHRPGKKAVRLIILREPLQRMLSFYRHVNNHPNHYLSIRPEVKGASFADFARYCRDAKVREFHDLQSQFVVGAKGNPQDVAQVIDTFESAYDFYAPLQMLPVLREELSRFFGKPAPDLVSRNVSREVPIDPTEVRAAADIVYAHNYTDLQLYDACTTRFMRFLDDRRRSAATPR